MPEVVLPLSVDKVRQLTNQLKAFSKALNDTVKVGIEQAVCMGVAEDVQMGIAAIQDVDGNYAGGSPSAVVVEVGLPGHDVIWRGGQIAYLEFGTGSAGARGGYPGAAMAAAGYQPDPSKTSWVYLNDGHAVVSFGGAPYAPMYNAGLAMRRIGALIPAREVVGEALRLAVTL